MSRAEVRNLSSVRGAPVVTTGQNVADILVNVNTPTTERVVKLHSRLDKVTSLEIVEYALYGVNNVGVAGTPDDPYYVLSVTGVSCLNPITHENDATQRGFPLLVTTAPYCAIQRQDSGEYQLLQPGQSTSLSSFRVQLRAMTGGATPVVTRLTLRLRARYEAGDKG